MVYIRSLDEDLVHYVGPGGDHRTELVTVDDLGLELLELVADLGLGAPGHLTADARTVRTSSERDHTHPGTVRDIPVDRTFAVPTAHRSRHNPDCSTEFGSWFGSVPGPSRSQVASDLWS